MRLEHHLVGGYVRYISLHIIIIIMYMYITGIDVGKTAETRMFTLFESR